MPVFAPTTEAVIARFEGLREELGSHVLGNYLSRHPDIADGPRLRIRCREDLDYHCAALLTALRLGDPVPFVRYVAWLASVLRNRRLTLEHLAESLDAMQIFLGHALPEAAVSLEIVFAAAREALAGDVAGDIVLLRPGLPAAPRLTRALLESDRRGAEMLVADEFREGRTATQINVGLFQASLYEVGDLWQQNRITVAHEHLATAMVQNLLTRTYAQAEFSAPAGRKIVLACVPGNHHELGLRMVSDAFEFAGWECFFLGGDTPLPALLALVDAEKPELVALSASLPGHVEEIRLAIDALHAEDPGRRPNILAGGLALNQDEALARRSGADDVVADALTAEMLARQ